MNDTTNYKTLEQIQEETTRTLYDRPFDMARAVALTNAVRELGAIVKTANPFNCVDRTVYSGKENQEEESVFVLGLWADLILKDGENVHVQMDENPFFDAYATQKIIREDENGKMYRVHYSDSVSGWMYAGVEFDNSPKTVARLTKNIKAEILRAANEPFTGSNSYTKAIPAGELKQEQVIYKN